MSEPGGESPGIDPQLERIRQERSVQSQQLIAAFREKFPTLPLVRRTPTENGGISIEDPIKDALHHLAGDLSALIPPQQVAVEIKSAADAVLAQKLGKNRLDTEVEGQWTTSQGLRFKRSLIMNSLVSPDSYKMTNRERVSETLETFKAIVDPRPLFQGVRDTLKDTTR